MRDGRVKSYPAGTWETLEDSRKRLLHGVPSKIAADRLALEIARLRELVAADLKYDSANAALSCETILEGERGEQWVAFRAAKARRAAALAALGVP